MIRDHFSWCSGDCIWDWTGVIPMQGKCFNICTITLVLTFHFFWPQCFAHIWLQREASQPCAKRRTCGNKSKWMPVWIIVFVMMNYLEEDRQFLRVGNAVTRETMESPSASWCIWQQLQGPRWSCSKECIFLQEKWPLGIFYHPSPVFLRSILVHISVWTQRLFCSALEHSRSECPYE